MRRSAQVWGLVALCSCSAEPSQKSVSPTTRTANPISVSIDISTNSLYVGTSVPFAATVLFSDGSKETLDPGLCTTTDPGVLGVDADAQVVRGLLEGHAELFCASGELVSKRVLIQVVDPQPRLFVDPAAGHAPLTVSIQPRGVFGFTAERYAQACFDIDWGEGFESCRHNTTYNGYLHIYEAAGAYTIRVHPVQERYEETCNCFTPRPRDKALEVTATISVRPPSDPFISIGAGSSHTCAVLASGGVQCWGRNDRGQLGTGNTAGSRSPVEVRGLKGAVSVSGAGDHSCALLRGGSVWCWGSNDDGQLGDGTFKESPVPVAVSGLTGATHVSAGTRHACAMLTDGSVWCWGDNRKGQLGDGTTTRSSLPVRVSGLSGARAVDSGREHVCVIDADGRIRCWGDNLFGQLGDGTTVASDVPILATASTVGPSELHARWRVVAAGGGHTCAIREDMSLVSCWGQNDYRQQDLAAMSLQPTGEFTSLPRGLKYELLVAGEEHTCVLASGGAVYCAGRDDRGQARYSGHQCNSGKTSNASRIGLAAAQSIDAGANHTCAILVGGWFHCWGYGEQGQLGRGNTDLQSCYPYW